MSTFFNQPRFSLKVLSAVSALFIFNLFNPLIVHAQDASSASEIPPSWTGFYFGVGLGAALTDLELDNEVDGIERQRQSALF